MKMVSVFFLCLLSFSSMAQELKITYSFSNPQSNRMPIPNMEGGSTAVYSLVSKIPEGKSVYVGDASVATWGCEREDFDVFAQWIGTSLTGGAVQNIPVELEEGIELMEGFSWELKVTIPDFGKCSWVNYSFLAYLR